MAHARRKFFDLHETNKRQIAEKVLHCIVALYKVGRENRELEPGDRQQVRRKKAATQRASADRGHDANLIAPIVLRGSRVFHAVR